MVVLINNDTMEHIDVKNHYSPVQYCVIQSVCRVIGDLFSDLQLCSVPLLPVMTSQPKLDDLTTGHLGTCDENH